MAWERLGSASGGSSSISVTITAKEYLRVIFQQNTAIQCKIQFNDDANQKYCLRRSENSGSDATPETDQTYMRNWNSGGATQRMTNMDIVNLSGEEKLCNIETVENTSGASGIPNRMESTGKYTEKTGQNTKVSFVALSGTIDSDATLTVFGASSTTTEDEKTTLTNVPTGTQYRETDTRKIYRRVASGTTSQETQNGGELFNDVEIVAQKFTSGSSKIGLIVDSVDVYLRNDTGSVSTSTDIECKIGQEWSSGVSYGTKSPSALSTSYSWQNFTPASAKRTIVENDRLMIRWADGTVTDNSIRWGSDNNAANQLPNETGEYSADDGSNWTARSFDRCYKINYSARWIERGTA